MSIASGLDEDIKAIERIDAVPLILDVVCRTTGMGFAAVARVTEDRWIACSVKDTIDFGLKPGGELPVLTTICDDIRNSGEGVIFDNADEDPLYRDHHTPKIYGLKSYISLPIRLKDGTFFGTLCAVDPEPRPESRRVNTPEVIGMFKLFAELIAQHLDNNDKIKVTGTQLAASEARLIEAEEAGTLREQFIAVLGHDLRNPLGAIASGASLLRRSPLSERDGRVVQMIEQSTHRMTELIENLLDFARGRLGSGISLHREQHTTLEPVLNQVVNELRVAWPNRAIQTRFDFRAPIKVDPHRLSQMASNLLGNAFSHGDPAEPVILRSASNDGMFVMTVSNSGQAIPSATMARLFQPFERGGGGDNGLGLGLYIASEIARAHGGELTAESSERETTFRFRMSLDQDQTL